MFSERKKLLTSETTLLERAAGLGQVIRKHCPRSPYCENAHPTYVVIVRAIIRDHGHDIFTRIQTFLQVLVAPQKKKLLQMYAFTGEKMLHLKDFNLPEVALCMARDEEFVCLGLAPSSGGSGEGRYIMLNIVDGKVSKSVSLLKTSQTHGVLIFLAFRTP